MSRVRNKFPTEIDAYCMNISNKLYAAGVKPGQIIKELDKQGVKGVTQGDVAYWRQKGGIENKFRFVAEVAIPDLNIERKDFVPTKKEEPHESSGAFVILPKSNVEHIKELCRDILSQLEALEYER